MFIPLIGLATILCGCSEFNKTVAKPVMKSEPTSAVEPVQADLGKMAGTWEVVEASNGTSVGQTYIFNGKELRIIRPRRPDLVQTIRIDSQANPKQLVMTGQVLTTNCIYKFYNDDTLVICMSTSNSSGFPENFDAIGFSKSNLCITLVRKK
jgi:uncharacterized protein (TIGR03067 family)